MELKNVITIAVTFVVIAIIISIGSDVISSVQDTQATTEGISEVNESGTFADGSLEVGAVSNPKGAFPYGGSALAFSNSTFTISNSTNSTIGTNNYLPFANGSMILKAGAEADLGTASLVNISYSYTIEATSFFYNITNDGLGAEEELASWLPTIAIIIMAAVIIGIIAAYFIMK